MGKTKITSSRFERRRTANLPLLFFVLFSTAVSPKPLLLNNNSSMDLEEAVSKELKLGETSHWRVKRQLFPSNSRATAQILENIARKKGYLLGKLAAKKSYLLGKLAGKKGQLLGWLAGGSGFIGESIAQKKGWILEQVASKKGDLLEDLASRKGDLLNDLASRGGDALKYFSGQAYNNQGGRKTYKGGRLYRMRSRFFN